MFLKREVATLLCLLAVAGLSLSACGNSSSSKNSSSKAKSTKVVKHKHHKKNKKRSAKKASANNKHNQNERSISKNKDQHTSSSNSNQNTGDNSKQTSNVAQNNTTQVSTRRVYNDTNDSYSYSSPSDSVADAIANMRAVDMPKENHFNNIETSTANN